MLSKKCLLSLFLIGSTSLLAFEEKVKLEIICCAAELPTEVFDIIFGKYPYIRFRVCDSSFNIPYDDYPDKKSTLEFPLTKPEAASGFAYALKCRLSKSLDFEPVFFPGIWTGLFRAFTRSKYWEKSTENPLQHCFQAKTTGPNFSGNIKLLETRSTTPTSLLLQQYKIIHDKSWPKTWAIKLASFGQPILSVMHSLRAREKFML